MLSLEAYQGADQAYLTKNPPKRKGCLMSFYIVLILSHVFE